MFNTWLPALALLLIGSSAAMGQTPAKEPDTLQVLLTEVHQLRQDIEAITVASQRMQIALFSLQMQDAAVARATARLDAARNRCSSAQNNRDHLVADVQRTEAALTNGTVTTTAPTEAAELRSHLSEMKTEADGAQSAVLACQSAESDASNDLRNEQAKLSDLQDRIGNLDKALEKLGIAEK